MRVGFLIDRWQPGRGGAERALARLARHLVERGHEVHAFGARGPAPGEQAPGVFHRVAGRGFSRGARERALADAMLDAAQSLACDVTVGVRHLPRVDVLWSHGGSHAKTMEAVRCARGGNPPGPAPPRGRHRAFLAFERALFAEGGARAVVCPSQLVRDELVQLYPQCSGRISIAPNGIDLERFHPRNRPTLGAALRAELPLGAAPETPLIAFAATNPELKGLPALFAALRTLGERPWHLLVAGPKHLARWRRAARRSGLGPDRVTLRPHVDGAALAAAADLLAHPTLRDTCGLVVLEALASGTPVVTTRNAGAAECITADVAGEVLAAGAPPAALALAIGRRLERLADGHVDRAGVRAAVQGRGEAPWLDTLEAILQRVHAAGPSITAPVRAQGRP